MLNRSIASYTKHQIPRELYELPNLGLDLRLQI